MNHLMKYILVSIFPLMLFANSHNKVKDALTQHEATVKLIFMISDAVHALQKERGASVGYIGSHGKQFHTKLIRLKADTDISKQKLLAYTEQESTLLQKYYYPEEHKSLKKLFSNLSDVRTRVASLQMNYPKTYSKYTQIIGALLLSISNVSDRLENKELMEKLYNYSMLLLYKESMGQKRAALSGFFSQKEFSKEIYEYFITADTQEKIYLKTFLRSVDADTKKLYFKLFKNNKDVLQVSEYEVLAFKKLQGEAVSANPEEWFDSITKKINLAKKVENHLISEITSLVNKLDQKLTIAFTPKEREWLASKPVIRYTYDPDWKPFEWKNGISQHVGIIADMLKLIEKKSGIRFVAKPANSWSEALGKLKSGSVDMISALAKTEERSKYADFTKNVIFRVPNVFVARKKDDFSNGFADIKGKKIAVIANYAVESMVKHDKPKLSLEEVDNVVEGLKKLKDGEIDLFVLNLATAGYYLDQENYKDLQIAYRTQYNFDLRIAFVQGYSKIALQTIDKVIAEITDQERNKIYNRWNESANTAMTHETTGISLSNILPLKEIFIITIIFLIVTLFVLKYLKNRADINIGIPVFIFGTIFSILTILIVVISVSNLEKVKKEEMKNSLVTIANSSHIALEEWYSNKKESIEYIVKHSHYLKNVATLVRKKEDKEFLKQNQQDMEKYYDDVTHSFKDRVAYFIATKDNTIVASSTKELIGTKIGFPFVIKEIQQAFENGYAFIHPKVDKADRYKLFANLYFLTPLYDAESGEVVAVYATGVDPQSMIRIMLEERLGKTGETYIINRRAQLISNSRFDEELKERGILKSGERSFLNLNVSFEGKPTLAAKSVLNKEDSYSMKAYKDYRGEMVYGAWLWDKDLHFGIITEIDKAEAMSSFDKLKQTIYFTVFSIIGFVIMLMIFIVWFSNRNRKALQEKNRELKAFSASLEHKVQERTAELREKQQKIDDEKNFISSIISSSQDALIVVDRASKVTIWNQSATKIFGYSQEEMLGESIVKIVPDKYKDLHTQGFFKVVNGGEKKLLGKGAIEIEGMHKDGKMIAIDLALNHFISDNQLFISANIRDITERKELVEKIKEQRQFSQTLLDSQRSIIISTDGKTIKSANRSFYKFFHIDKLEEFTVHHNCICDKFTAVATEEYLLPKMGDQTWVEYIISNPFKRHIALIDGRLFVVNVEKSSFNNETLYVAVFTDVTALEQSQKDLKYALQTIENTNKKIHDSIEYASFIQGALIPDNELLNRNYSDTFVIWHPKDIVGGDIYLFEELRTQDESLLMVIDCTGHGVPGAFVTMLVKAIERQIVAKIQNDATIDVSPAWILSYFNRKMKQLLKQEDKDSLSNAGFDGGIIYYNKKDKILKFAGAETPLFYVEDGELKTIKGSRHSIGYKTSDISFAFTEHTLEVKEGMQFYLTTDGYLDQNGGEKGFPLGKKRFKEIISKSYKETMADQKEIFLSELDRYQGKEERNDDVTLIGFKI